MKSLKVLAVAVAASAALVLSTSAPAKSPPFPMNPYGGGSSDPGYAFYLQTLIGHGSKYKPTAYCAQSSVFPRGTQVVFRLVIFNTTSGKIVTGKDLSNLTLKIQGVPDITVAFKPQGGNPDATSPWLWATPWTVPADYPLGKFVFKFVAKVKKTGKAVTYDPVVPGTEWQVTPAP